MEVFTQDHSTRFLSGGGEMGALTRAKDWSKTVLGPVEYWPQSLKTSLGIILNSKFPMFLWWGPELICFYNDAYRPSLGENGKHPDILGMRAEEAWPEIWDIIKPLIDQVLEGGESTWSEDQLIPIFRNGRLEDVYWTFSYSPVIDESGAIAGVLVTCSETTEKVRTFKHLEASNSRYHSDIMQAPVAMCILRNRNHIVEIANDRMLELWGKTAGDMMNKPLIEGLPEIKGQGFEELLNNVFETGETFEAFEAAVSLPRQHEMETIFVNFIYKALREANGSISGIVVIAVEVTGQVLARKKLEESEQRVRTILESAPFPIGVYVGREMRIQLVNQTILKVWGKGNDVVGKLYRDVLPEVGEEIYQQLDEVFTTGIPYQAINRRVDLVMHGELKSFYFNYTFTPLYDGNGNVYAVMNTAADVTDLNLAKQQLEENEEKLNIVITASELGIWELDLQTKHVNYSARYREILGYAEPVTLTHQEILQHLHPDDLPIREKAFVVAFETGILHYKSRIIWLDGSIHWIEGRGKMFYNSLNEPVKLMGTVRDITEEKNFQEKLQEREQKFRLLADSMPQLVWTGDIDGNLNYFNQSVYSYSGLSPEHIEKDGWIQIVHEDDKEENIKKWIAAITSGDDFLFEHRFRRHDGQYRWQLSRAIPQKDSTGNIQMWVGTSTDIEDQKTFTRKLEQQVQERTRELEQKNVELEKMNTELQSFAYVSSHDLQEPLRKIQTFASRILEKENENLSDNGKDYFRRMQDSANRMQTLIDDLLTYSRTNITERNYVVTDLNEILSLVKTDLKEELLHKHAVIESNGLCEVAVIPFQFRQLLNNLISNSLKFSKPDLAPVIKLHSEIIKGDKNIEPSLSAREMYCHLQLSDNGIGFEPQYKDRIFEVFQRLHGKKEYKGTGIGLAIVKKIAENHNGFINATGVLGEGASFDIYFPLR